MSFMHRVTDFMHRVIMTNVIMLNVVAPSPDFITTSKSFIVMALSLIDGKAEKVGLAHRHLKIIDCLRPALFAY